MQNKYIIGAGIAGLIAKHYNPEYTIISPEVGGQLTTKNLSFCFYVHDTPENRELLDSLKLKYKPRRTSIFYYYKNKLLRDVTTHQRIKIIKHKMAEFDYDSNSVDVLDTTTSTQTNYIDILDTNLDQLIKKLTPKDIKIGKVKLINNNRKFILLMNQDNKIEILNYEKLISTIPANDFFHMLYNYESNYKLKYLPTTYVLSSSKPDFATEPGMYYVYSDELIYNRLTLYDNGQCVYDITGMPTDAELYSKIKDIVNVERRYCGIVKSEEIDDLKNIKFIGRLAEWQHGTHIETNIKKAKHIGDKK